MTHYQKLATMIFRIIGTVFLVFGVMTSLLVLFFIFAEPRMALPIAISYSLPTIVLGIVFFSFSRLLSGWVCFDFDKRF